MKRKFFPMMVAACAALFSFSGLTGCSGGSDGMDTISGVVTLNDFVDLRKAFSISTGGTYEITVDPRDKVQVDAGLDPEDAHATGQVVMLCKVNNKYTAKVYYYISGWNGDVPVDGSSSSAGTTSTGLLIAFEPGLTENAGVASDDQLVRALGGLPPNDSLLSDIKVGLNYSTRSCETRATVGYVDSSSVSTPVPNTMQGTFSVIRRQ